MNLVFRNSNSSSAFKHSKNGTGSGADMLEDSSTLGSNEAEPPNPSKNRSGSTHSNSSSSDRSVPSTSPSSSHMVHSHSKQSTTMTTTSHKHHAHHHHKTHSDKKKRRALNFLNNIPTEHVNRDSHTNQTSGTILKPTSTDSSSGGGGSRSHAISSSPPNLITTTTKSTITNVSPRPRGYTASSRLESPTEDKSKGAYTIVVSSTTATTTTLLENSSSSDNARQHSSPSKLTVNIPKPEPKTIANPIVDGSEQKSIEQNDLTSKTKLHSNNNDKKHQDHHHHHRYNQLHHPHPKHHHHSHKTKTKALDFLSNIPMRKVDSLENILEKTGTFTLKTSPSNNNIATNAMPKFLKQINTLDEAFDSTNESPDIENQKEVDESNEDGYIRRLHLMQKNSSIPFLVCSFIKPKKNLTSGFPNSSTGSTPLPTSATSIPTLCSPVVDHTLVDTILTSEELISKQMELEAITVSKKPTSYRSYILEPLKCEAYDPLFLDDPNIRTASKRKVMTFPGIVTSTIPFLKSKALKKDLNEQFRQQHEHCLLSLSKIRKLKRRILKVILKQKPDELTIAALAFVYLEKMILKNLVHKTNRKRIAAACLFLAFKMTLESTHDQRKEMISDFLDEIESVFEVGRKKVVQTEFFVMSEGLHFNMNTDIRDIQPHLQRLLDEDQDRQVLFNRSLNRV